MSASRSRSIQNCAFCKNHDEVNAKKDHQCKFKDCTCKLCELTRISQKTMKHQQRVWRFHKNQLREYKTNPNIIVDEGVIDSEGQLIGQVCDKCRNHNHLTKKKNHTNCPYIKCNCKFCSLTYKRREIMKHQQRVRRSNLVTKVVDSSGENIQDSRSCSPHDKEFEDISKSETFLDQKEDYISDSSSNASYADISPCSPSPSTSDDFSSNQRLTHSPPPLIPINEMPTPGLENEIKQTEMDYSSSHAVRSSPSRNMSSPPLSKSDEHDRHRHHRSSPYQRPQSRNFPPSDRFPGEYSTKQMPTLERMETVYVKPENPSSSSVFPTDSNRLRHPQSGHMDMSELINHAVDTCCEDTGIDIWDCSCSTSSKVTFGYEPNQSLFMKKRNTWTNYNNE